MNVYACNPRDSKFFNALPDAIRSSIMGEMAWIDTQVRKVWDNPVVTSAFRTPQYSRSLNGNANSRHAWGAIDYSLAGAPQPCEFEGLGLFVLFEKDHVHVHRQ